MLFLNNKFVIYFFTFIYNYNLFFGMFESKSQIINFHDQLVNQVDIFFEQQSRTSKFDLDYRNDLIQKIKELETYNLSINDKKFKFCFFFGKIDHLYRESLTRLNFDDQSSEIKFGLLLITNDLISKEIYDKLNYLIDNGDKAEIFNYENFNSLETIIKLKIIYELMVKNFNHPIIDLTDTLRSELETIETTFISKNLNEKQLEFIPQYLNLVKVKNLICHSNLSLFLENIPNGLFRHLKFLSNVIFSTCNIHKLICHNFIYLENLIFLQFFHCCIRSIEPNTFYGLKNLYELHITDNYIVNLVPEVFNGLDNLSYLNLDANLIETIRENNFIVLKNLRHLRLTTNCIKKFENGCFNGLNNLKILRLSYNKRLVFLDPEIFKPISNLEALYLNNMEFEGIDTDVFKYLSNLKFLDFSFTFTTCTDARILNNLKSLQVLKICKYDRLENMQFLNLSMLRMLVFNQYDQYDTFQLGKVFDNLQLLIIDNFFGFGRNFFENLKSLEYLAIYLKDFSIIEAMVSDDFKLVKKLKYFKIELDNKSEKEKLESKICYFKNLFDSNGHIEHKLWTSNSKLNLEIMCCQSRDAYLNQHLKITKDLMEHVYEAIFDFIY